MKDLTEFLLNMPELDEPAEPIQIDESAVEYLEDVSLDFAKIVLQNKFDASCSYKLITMPDSTVLTKFNPNWPEGKEPIYDREGRIIDGPVVEYVLDTPESEVQSYANMCSEVANNSTNVPTMIGTFNGPRKQLSMFLPVLICVVLFIIGLWAASLIIISS